jgi:lectin family protein
MGARIGAFGLRGLWALGWICGLIITCSPRVEAQTAVPLGAVLTVSAADYSDIDTLNAAVGNRPLVLHHNHDVVTLSFSRPDQIRLPQRLLGSIRLINFHTKITDQTPPGAQVSTVAAAPTTESYVPGHTLFLLMLTDMLQVLEAVNKIGVITTVHQALVVIGGHQSPVTLVAADAAQLVVPTGYGYNVVQQLNTNVALPPPTVPPPYFFIVPPPAVPNGSATVSHGGQVPFHLTSSSPWQAGSVWLQDKQPIAGGFLARFTFQISNPGGTVDQYGQRGADGFAFVLQNVSPSALGDPGSGLGYNGISDSLAVEFDTWWNPELGDPNGNHISVHTGGPGPNSTLESDSLGWSTALPNLKDGAPHQVNVLYQPGLMLIFVDDFVLPVLELPVDLSQILRLNGGQAWVGFTAGTGAAFETHDILSVDFQGFGG